MSGRERSNGTGLSGKGKGTSIMMAATHRLGGAAAGIALSGIFIRSGSGGAAEGAILIAGAVLGSLIPDIDNARSSISRKVPLARAITGLFQAAARGISNLLPSKGRKLVRGAVGHRGITHSLAMCLITAGALWGIGRQAGLDIYMGYRFFAAGLVAGIASHLVLDMFAGGVPLFCPVSNARVTLAHIKTGGVVEWLVRIASAALLAGVILLLGLG